MTDYQGNSKKEKEAANVPPKKVERVVVNEVIVQKKGIGRKFKDLFIEADPKTVTKYVALTVLLPAAKNMFFDAISKGSERMIYGESASQRRNYGMGPRITYNNPVDRRYPNPLSPIRETTQRYAPPISQEPRTLRYNRNDFILSSREEGELVLERMTDIVDTYGVASVADLNELVGFPTTHVDNKWGWSSLTDVQIRQVREGYLIDFPPADPIA